MHVLKYFQCLNPFKQKKFNRMAQEDIFKTIKVTMIQLEKKLSSDFYLF